MLRLTQPFSPSVAGFYRKQSGLPWLGMLDACRGRVALEVWHLNVEGVALRFSLFADRECFRLQEVDGDAEVRCVIVPGEQARMSVRLVDSGGAWRDLDLIPQPSLSWPLLVFVNAMPLTFKRS